MKKLFLIIFFILIVINPVSADYTVDKCTGGTATASSSSTPASQAFDNSITGNNWWTANTANPEWVQYDFGSGVAWPISRVRVYPTNYLSTNWCKTVSIDGSNNNSDWTSLIGSTATTKNIWNNVDFTNTTAYRYVRVNALTTDASNMSIYEIEMMYDDSVSISGTLKEKTSDATGAAYNLLVLDHTNSEVFAFATADSSGDYEITPTNDTDEYCGIIIDNIGGAVYDGNWGTTTTDASGDWTLTDAGWSEGETVWVFFVDPDETLKTTAFDFTANASNTVADTHYLDIAHTSAAEDFIVYAAGFGTATGYEPPNPIFDFVVGGP